MQLIIDIGNTLTKLAVFSQDQLVELSSTEDLNPHLLSEFIKKYPRIKSSILSAVKVYEPEIDIFLGSKTHYVKFNHTTHLPFVNDYGTPETIGKDRLAAVAGASDIAPNSNVLVIDAGTCITYDILTSENVYLGGAISPGIQMRFMALNTFTGNLPLIHSNQKTETELVGKTTHGSILSGVNRAVISEVDGMINEYRLAFDGLKVVVTGGDFNYFDKYLKNSIFAAPNLVLIGLKKILEINEGS